MTLGDMTLVDVPESLQRLKAYADRANELRVASPASSYALRLLVMTVGLQLKRPGDEDGKRYLNCLMDTLEAERHQAVVRIGDSTAFGFTHDLGTSIFRVVLVVLALLAA